MTCEELICTTLSNTYLLSCPGTFGSFCPCLCNFRAYKLILTTSEKEAKSVFTYTMSGLQSSQPLESTPCDLSQFSRGGDTNHTQPNDQSNKTDRGTYESGRSRASNSLAGGATSASGGTQDDLQDGEPSSPDLFDLLKSQCPKHFEGRADMKAAWSALAYQLRINVVRFTWLCTKAHCGGKSLHYEVTLPHLGETSRHQP
jgi:hypothetical protein